MKKLDRQYIMIRAWNIAKRAEVKFRGKASEYFAMALKMAWAEYRLAKAPKAEITIDADTRRNKTWVAAITGTHPVYKLNRQFLNPYYIENDEKIFKLNDGLYEIYDGRRRFFIQVTNGTFEVVEKEFVTEVVA